MRVSVVIAARLSASLADTLVLAVILRKTVSVRRYMGRHSIRTSLLTALIFDGVYKLCHFVPLRLSAAHSRTGTLYFL